MAVLITFGVGAVSFALSFNALRDLATRGHIPAGQAWMWPLMVDGAIILATLGVVVNAGDPLARRDRRFFWMVLVGGALVSVTGNALHAILSPEEPLGTWLRGFIAAVAPVALLVTTEGLNRLTRRHNRAVTVLDDRQFDVVARVAPASPLPEPAQAPRGTTEQEQDVAAGGNGAPGRVAKAEQSVVVPPDSRWHGIAPKVLAQGSLAEGTECDAVAKVLHLSYDRAMTNREIGRQLGMSHHTVGKIQSVGARVLQETPVSAAAS
ncbi:hypothetical protein A5710_14375 [Mycolicibacter sinensis]|uniref:DUF2637 domain-containing protein n=1 Tax=Mycolicibacter sinensis (strain JDM601) TaxID=875328 RepID=A0A1A2Y615_MYCSD|nr:hypothetical protein A5710_14375 [Mycolicibacter sinensis]